MAIFYSPGHSDALVHAIRLLHDESVEFLPCPDRHVTHLLLPVPSFEADGTIKGGGSLEQLLWQLPPDVTVIGGNLTHPELIGYKTIDLLLDPTYLCENASITAYCALRLAAAKLPVTLKKCPVLVIGWGRIGKCLARLLRRLDANVTVAARKAADRAMLEALGCRTVDTGAIDPTAYRLIFNTAPVMLLPACSGNALKIDLASQPGIGGQDVIHARGLPGKDAPESSGTLIAKTILKKLQEEVSAL